MKNKSFENYYDDIHVDDSLLQQIPIKKHHYLKPILVISCCLLLFVFIFQNTFHKLHNLHGKVLVYEVHNL